MVLNRHQPEALLIHLRDDSLLAEPGVRLALATALYKDESLSLGRAAKFAGQRLVDFIEHVSQIGHTGGAGSQHDTRGHGDS